MTSPMLFRYCGEGEFQPASEYWGSKADASYVVGEVYKLAPFEDRSQASHNHEFAVIADMWASLPDRFKHEPWAQSPEHLRKYALIMCAATAIRRRTPAAPTPRRSGGRRTCAPSTNTA